MKPANYDEALRWVTTLQADVQTQYRGKVFAFAIGMVLGVVLALIAFCIGLWIIIE